MDRFGIYFVILLGFVHSSGWSQVSADLTTCDYTGTAYNEIQPRDAAAVPTEPVDGSSLKICQAAKTCCTRRMEQQLLDTASSGFNNALQDELSYLEYSISSSAQDFHGEFNELLRYGKERIKQYFGNIYSNIAKFLEDDIQQLFETLKDHLRGRPANVPIAVEHFFDELFALLYTDQINPRVGRLNGVGSRCIAGQQRTIRPFGDAPQEIGTRLYKSIELSRLLLTSLHLGVEVLNSTHHMQLGKKCRRALLEMKYCGTCQGLTTVKPCNSYCINVMKGCLANFIDIDPDWNDYVTSVINLVRWSMNGDYDLQLAVHSLDVNIVDAISIAKEDSERIIEEVSNLCKTPLRSRPSPQSRDFAIQQPSLSIPMAPNPNVPLDERLLAFVDSLDSSRMLYRSLARGLCSDRSLDAARLDDSCWNGEEVGRYTEPIVEDGLEAQKSDNPEVSWSGRELELMQAMSLMDKLQHVVQSQETWTREQQIGDISLEDEFSGSGSGSGGCMGEDDADCEESGEKSGMTMTTTEPDSMEESGEAGTTPDSDFTFEPSSRQQGSGEDKEETMTTKATKGEGSNVRNGPDSGVTKAATVSSFLLIVGFLMSWQQVL